MSEPRWPPPGAPPPVDEYLVTFEDVDIWFERDGDPVYVNDYMVVWGVGPHNWNYLGVIVDPDGGEQNGVRFIDDPRFDGVRAYAALKGLRPWA